MDSDTLLDPGHGFDLHWQMSPAERLAILWTLERLRPKLSLEIGTYCGGSLQAISKFSERVISLDIDPGIPERLNGRFENVDFLTGDSAQMLPGLIDKLNDEGPPEFILIDGDHKSTSVRRDIESVLHIKPKRTTVVFMHDSFNPDCRSGIMTAPWETSPHVTDLEIDFMTGHFFDVAHSLKYGDQMWGGFARAIIEPEIRSGSLQIKQRQKLMFDNLRQVSAHCRQVPIKEPKAPSAAFRFYRRSRIAAGKWRRRLIGV